MKPLSVIGNVNVDIILGPAEPWPQPGTEILVEHDELRIGGAAGNVALAWMAMGIDFEIAGNVGNDRFGVWLADAFGERAKAWRRHSGNTTLSVGITHPNGERTFFTTAGHLPHFSLDDVLAVLDGSRLSGGYSLLCGSFLTDSLTANYPALFDWTHRHGIHVALDPGWPPEGWTLENQTAVTAWLSRSGIALLNEVEGCGLTGLSDPLKVARAIRASMPPNAIVVIKRGPEGAFALGADDIPISYTAPKVAVIDTIGAGDVFNAAFLSALTAGQSLPASIKVGVDVASRAISTQPRSYQQNQ